MDVCRLKCMDLRVGQCGWLRIGHGVLVRWTVWMCAVCGFDVSTALSLNQTVYVMMGWICYVEMHLQEISGDRDKQHSRDYHDGINYVQVDGDSKQRTRIVRLSRQFLM